MLVSSFELLFKNITPTTGQAPGSGRIILQGYFLTISNPSTNTLNFRHSFNATTPSLNLADTIQITDVSGGNSFGDLSATADPNRFTLNVRIPGRDTALVILQPDITLPNLPTTVEFRGFVEIEITTRTVGGQTFDVLLTPEHRGTFLPNNFAPPPANNVGQDFDQLIVSLPTATGGSLFKLPSRQVPFTSPVGDLKPIVDNVNPIPFPFPPRGIPEPQPGPGLAGAGAAGGPELQAAVARLQNGLSLMAQTIDSLASSAADGDSFVTPEP